MTAIVSDWVDSTAGSAIIAAMITTIDSTGGTSQVIYNFKAGNGIRFYKMYY